MPEEKSNQQPAVGKEPEEVKKIEHPPIPRLTPLHTEASPTVPSKTKHSLLTAALLVIVSTSAGFGGGWLGARSEEPQQSVEKQQVVLKSQAELISRIAKDSGASVVSISVTSKARPSFFDTGTMRQSAGTGFIINKNGMIITNRHVIPEGASKVAVTLSDGTAYDDVEVIGRTADSDPLDIAFLKIGDTKGKDLTVAKIGDSSRTSVGESVVAIGNALGQFQNSVTSGIISGYGRNLEAGDGSGGKTESLQNLFQTDAAINPGNSGGPLVNLNGEVIGINTAVAGNGAQNIGFAIPINDVKGMIDSVQKKGKLERPYLGVVYVTITADMAKRYNLSAEQGAYVPPSLMVGSDSVIDGGPADKAGIKEGDIITKIGDQKLDEKHSITSVIGAYEVGEKVQVTLIRDGKTQIVEVTLAALPQ